MTRRVVTLWIAPLGGRDLTRGHLAGWLSRDGRTPRRVPTAADLSADAIPAAAYQFDTMVHDELARDPDVLVVGAGHSQGCQAIGAALAGWIANPTAAPDPDRVSILLTGNPERPHYGYLARRPKWIGPGNSVRLTPEATAYPVLDIGRKGDLWANYPGGLLSILKLAGNREHSDYSRVDPDHLNPLEQRSYGNTVYVNVP